MRTLALVLILLQIKIINACLASDLMFNNINLNYGLLQIVTSKNLSEKNTFIQPAILNGKVWNQSWFRNSDIKNGEQSNLSWVITLLNGGKMNVPHSCRIIEKFKTLKLS